MRVVVILFFIFTFLHVFLVYQPLKSIPQLTFPYQDILDQRFGPSVLHPFAEFDGIQYLTIARNGYGHFQQGYFPLFPVLIALLTPLSFGSQLFASIFISFVSFFLGLVYLRKYIMLLVQDKTQVRWALIFLVTFPTAFFYEMAYSTSLLLFVSSAALYYLCKRQYVLAGIFATLSSLTSVQGALLVVPFFISLVGVRIPRHDVLEKSKVWLQKNYRLLFVILSPLYGLLAYSLYLFMSYKDPLLFYHSQSAFGANRSVTQIILLPQVLFRYIKIFLFSERNFPYMIALLEFSLFCFVFSIFMYKIISSMRHKINNQEFGLYVYSLIAVLLPTLTGTLTSVPRYILASFGIFIALAEIKNTMVKASLVIFFFLLQIILLIFFLRGYFIS